MSPVYIYIYRPLSVSYTSLLGANTAIYRPLSVPYTSLSEANRAIYRPLSVSYILGPYIYTAPHLSLIRLYRGPIGLYIALYLSPISRARIYVYIYIYTSIYGGPKCSIYICIYIYIYIRGQQNKVPIDPPTCPPWAPKGLPLTIRLGANRAFLGSFYPHLGPPALRFQPLFLNGGPKSSMGNIARQGLTLYYSLRHFFASPPGRVRARSRGVLGPGTPEA